MGMSQNAFDLKIPVFNVDLAPAGEMLDSIARVRDRVPYGHEDIVNISNWIGMCGFQYLWDTREDYFLTETHEYQQEFYRNKCHKVSKVTASLLAKLNVQQYLWYTNTATQQNIGHVGTLGVFHFNTHDTAVLYDHSLRQYFKTNRDGCLLYDQNTGKKPWILYQYLLPDDGLREIAFECMKTGSSYVGDASLASYVKGFVDAARRWPTYNPQMDTSHVFLCDPEKSRADFLYERWAQLPESEQDIKDLARRQTLQRLKL